MRGMFMLQVREILTDQAAEVHKHFADLIFFQGCNRNCCYCFNPELIPFKGGEMMTVGEITNKLGALSDVVVLTGGEPISNKQNKLDLFTLITNLKFKGKYVILETSNYDNMINPSCDKVLYTIKTFEPDYYLIEKLTKTENTDLCIVIGHDCFDWTNFKKIIPLIKKEIYFRFYNNIPADFSKLYHYVKSHNKEFKVLYRIVI